VKHFVREDRGEKLKVKPEEEKNFRFCMPFGIKDDAAFPSGVSLV
jgi:hypothetical protein